MKTREQKQLDLTALKEEFQNTGNAVMVSFQGLSVEKDGELRRALEAAQLNYRVVKNTIGRIAVQDTPLETLKDHFKGMTALAYSNTD
ncbi:MAG: 50S ribosomal protein L10, partial [Blastocatellia bacterium]